MPSEEIRDVIVNPFPLAFSEVVLGIKRAFRTELANARRTRRPEHHCAKPMSQGGLGGRPVPARCARMTLMHALTLNVDV